MALTKIISSIIEDGTITGDDISASANITGSTISASVAMAAGVYSGGVISGSGQVSGALPTGTMSGSAQTKENLPAGVISGSGNLSASLPPGTMSGSAQTKENLPTGTISASMGICGSSISTGSFGSVHTAGNVGIGTASPSDTLDIEGAGAGIEINATSGNPGISFHENGANENAIYRNASDNVLLFAETDVGNHMAILDGGNVGIGTTSPACALEVNGGIEITSGGSGYIAMQGKRLYLDGGSDTFIWESGANTMDFLTNGSTWARIVEGGDFYTNDGSVSSLSDVRVKKDIADLTDGLSIVNQLKPRTYKYNGKGEMGSDDGITRYGFIADEVLDVASNYVNVQSGTIDEEKVDDLKSLSIMRMIPMLVKSIQELSAKVEALENA